MNKPNTPICYNPSEMGIGNRIKNLISFLRQTNTKEFVLVWDTQLWVTAPFKDLFVLNHEYKIEESSNCQQYNAKTLEYKPTWRLLIKDTDNIPTNFSKISINKGIKCIDFEYNRIPQEIINTYKTYFQKLSPSEPVQKLIDSVKLPENTVAVQIRNNKDWDNVGRNENINKFVKSMKRYPDNTIFFISTMDAEISKQIKKIFPDRIIELPDKNYKSMQHAVADMFLLGRTKEAIYSFGSTFSEVGWWFGGCKTKVHTIGSAKNWKMSTQDSNTNFTLQKLFAIKNEYRIISDKKYKSKYLYLLGLKIRLTK